MNIKELLKLYHIKDNFYKINNIYIYCNPNYTFNYVVSKNKLSDNYDYNGIFGSQWLTIFPELNNNKYYIYSNLDLNIIVKILRKEKLKNIF